MTQYIFRCSAILAIFLCCWQVALASDIMVVNATARASLTPKAQTAAVYFSIMNHGSVEDELLSLSTPSAAAAEIHETQMQGEVMKMRKLAGPLAIPPGAMIELKPGAMHVMLTGLKSPLIVGQTVQFELTFAMAGVVKIEIPVGEASAAHTHAD